MPAAELGGFDSFLQRHAEVHHIEKKLQGPLVLLVEAHGAEGHKGFAVAQHQRRGEGGAWPFAGASALGWWGSR